MPLANRLDSMLTVCDNYLSVFTASWSGHTCSHLFPPSLSAVTMKQTIRIGSILLPRLCGGLVQPSFTETRTLISTASGSTLTQTTKAVVTTTLTSVTTQTTTTQLPASTVTTTAAAKRPPPQKYGNEGVLRITRSSRALKGWLVECTSLTVRYLDCERLCCDEPTMLTQCFTGTRQQLCQFRSLFLQRPFRGRGEPGHLLQLHH